MMRDRRKSSWRHSMAAVPLSVFAVLLLTVNPASASPKSTPTPAVTSWRGSPTSLSDAGGTVTFTGKFKYAQTCVLSVTPHITGSPWTTTCTSNSYSKKIAVARNTTGAARDYTFSFYVKNATGKTQAPNVVVAEGAAPPPISFTPTTLTFPSSAVGISTTPVNVLVTNNSTTQTQQMTPEIQPIGPDAYDYSVAQGNCNVALSPRQSCDISVTFKPQSNGSRIATAQVFDSTWGPTGTFALLPIHGTGEFATASVSTTDLVFENEGVSAPSNYEAVTITNSGSVPLAVTGVGISGNDNNDFSENPNTCQLVSGDTIVDVGHNCSVLLQFDPTAAGARSSSLVVSDNTASGVTDIKLSGTGVWATSTLSTNSITFPSTVVGSSSSVLVTITNTSAVGLRLSPAGYSFTGQDTEDFSYSPSAMIGGVPVQCTEPGLIIGPGQACQFTLAFNPISGGPRSASFELFDNTLNNNSTPGYEQITLSGTATT